MNKLYTIGQASAMIDIPVKTIRYYESIGLCRPSVTDESSGYRYYSIDDIFRLDLIRCLGRQLGMPLANIKNYLDEDGNSETLKQYLIEQELEIDVQIRDLIVRKRFLADKLSAIIERENTPPLSPVLLSRRERNISVLKGNVDSLEDGMLFARKMIAQYGTEREKDLYVIFPELSGSFSGTKDFYAGLDLPSVEGLSPMHLPAGNYLSLHYYNRPGQREEAIRILEEFMALHKLQREGPVINGGSLLDMSSTFSKDYYFALEFLVKPTEF